MKPAFSTCAFALLKSRRYSVLVNPKRIFLMAPDTNSRSSIFNADRLVVARLPCAGTEPRIIGQHQDDRNNPARDKHVISNERHARRLLRQTVALYVHRRIERTGLGYAVGDTDRRSRRPAIVPGWISTLRRCQRGSARAVAGRIIDCPSDIRPCVPDTQPYRDRE